MFVLFMAARDKSVSITVAAKDVVMVYKGQEYHMPTLAELREDYSGEIRDLDFYRKLGKEGIISSWVRFYEFPERANFFPPLTLRSTLAVTEGHMSLVLRLHDARLLQEPRIRQGGHADDQGQGREEPVHHWESATSF